jgi:histidinol-phosphate aminotransferase
MRGVIASPESLGAVREAVRRAPAYPFTPLDAPVKLDQNESGYDFPAELKAVALERLAAVPWNRYPDMNADRLRASLSKHLHWAPDGLVVTTGSNVLIHALAQIAGLGATVLSVQPGFSLYALSAKLLGTTLVQVPLEPDFGLPMPALLRELERASGVLYLAEPHAPTGALHDAAQLETLIEAARDWIVVVDEAYFEYSGVEHTRFLSRANVCILRTFSKAWGLGGLRLGYLMAQPALAVNVQKILSPFNVSALQMAVAGVALEQPGYVQARVQETVQERDRVFDALQAHPTWHSYPSHANYHLIRTPDAAQAHEALLEHGVLVRRQDSLPGLEGCIRVSVGTPEENSRFLEAAGVGR